MRKKSLQVVKKVMHPEAEKRVEEYALQFANLLILQSKAAATLDRADEVQSFHVDSARERVYRSFEKQQAFKGFAKNAGWCVIGATIGFLKATLDKPPISPGWIVGYFVAFAIACFGLWYGHSK